VAFLNHNKGKFPVTTTEDKRGKGEFNTSSVKFWQPPEATSRAQEAEDRVHIHLNERLEMLGMNAQINDMPYPELLIHLCIANAESWRLRMKLTDMKSTNWNKVRPAEITFETQAINKDWKKRDPKEDIKSKMNRSMEVNTIVQEPDTAWVLV
jgi:hypothetical protein